MLDLQAEEMGHRLLDILRKADEERWTGVLNAVKGSQQFGTIFMHEGQMAWATCKEQKENFGYFLEKVGMIPKEQQREIFERYKALGKTKEIGALIEETGLISRAKLRECLKGHIRSAVFTMIDNAEIGFGTKECEVNATPDLLFGLDDVLEKNGEAEPPVDDLPAGFQDARSGEIDSILESLASLKGYQYSFICDSSAKLVTSHKSETLTGDMDEVISSSTSWIVSSAAMLLDLQIGKMGFVLVEHDRGTLTARCPTCEKEFFVAASFDESGKSGVIKHKISEIFSDINLNTAEKH